MAPNFAVVSEQQTIETNKSEEHREYKKQIVWFNVLLFVYLHLSGWYGFYLGYTSADSKTLIFALIYGYLGGLGVTAGLHRLWAHRSYKAKWPLRTFYCLCACIAGQNDIYVWCRDHRVHHKFTDTDADPHNIQRGFFFAHMGWLMCKKHPDVTTKGKTVPLDDLWADPIVRFHRKFYMPMFVIFSFIVPALIPTLFWNESLWTSFFSAGMCRYYVSLNVAWLVNSAAHYWGDQPYDKYIEARQNPLVSLFALGEGWHNYHHVFPWDYSTSELGYTFNLTKVFIDLMALCGQAYDLKAADHHMIKSRQLKTGVGTAKFVEISEDELRKTS